MGAAGGGGEGGIKKKGDSKAKDGTRRARSEQGARAASDSWDPGGGPLGAVEGRRPPQRGLAGRRARSSPDHCQARPRLAVRGAARRPPEDRPQPCPQPPVPALLRTWPESHAVLAQPSASPPAPPRPLPYVPALGPQPRLQLSAPAACPQLLPGHLAGVAQPLSWREGQECRPRARPGGGGGLRKEGAGSWQWRLGRTVGGEHLEWRRATVGGGSWSGSWGLAGARARRTVGAGPPWCWQVAPGPERLQRVVLGRLSRKAGPAGPRPGSSPGRPLPRLWVGLSCSPGGLWSTRRTP